MTLLVDLSASQGLGTHWQSKREQSGSLGRAIANYERVLLLDPTNTKAQSNLAAARQAVPTTASDSVAGNTLSHTLEAVAARLNRFVSPSAGAMLLAAAWIIFWATLLARFYGSWQEQCRLSLRESTPFRGAKGDNRPKRRWRYALVPAACLLLACLALVGLQRHRAQPRGQHGIVAMQAAILRQAPGENFPAVTGQPLSEGQCLKVLQDRDAWLQVQTPDGQTGWTAAAQIERVTPL